jgi:hypothetical protein
MKKLFVAMLTMVLVFAVVATVSAAAPVVTGKLQYEVYGSSSDEFADARLFFNGDIDKQTNYTVSLQYVTPGYGSYDFVVREAYTTYKSDLGNVSFGKIRVTPSIVDNLYGINYGFGAGETKAPFVVKYSYNFSDDTNVGLTVIPRDQAKVDAGAYVAEFHTKVSIVNLGLNYQSAGHGDAGYALQASTTLFENLNLWTELGKWADINSDYTDDQNKALYVGGSYTFGKFTVEAEKQCNGKAREISPDLEQWGGKVSFAATKNMTFELYKGTDAVLGNLPGTTFFKAIVTF